MKALRICLLFFLFAAFLSVEAQTSSSIKADSFFYAGNLRLRSKWNLIDTTTFRKSINDYTHAIALKPEFWQAYRNRARIYLHQKKYEMALEDLTTAILYADKHSLPKIFEMRGVVFYELGMNKETIDDLNVAIKDPEDRGKTLLYLARAKYKLGYKKEACRNYQEAIRLNKNLKVKNEIVKCD